VIPQPFHPARQASERYMQGKAIFALNMPF